MATSLVFLVPLLALAQNNTLTPAEQKSGWTLLFDGKTMERWVDPRTKTPPGDAWTIEDDALKSNSHPHITEDLFTRDTFRDFELSFDWRISPAGNSGVKYRIQDHNFLLPTQPGERFEALLERTLTGPEVPRREKGQDYVIGFEYQITDNETNRDAKANGPKHSTAALYDLVPPTNAAPRPVGEFNTSRIVVKGNHTEHWLNGVKVVEADLDDAKMLQGLDKRWGKSPHVYEQLTKQPRKNCPISLQNHGDEAWFRNIKIRRL